jgi:hypothetical protein
MQRLRRHLTYANVAATVALLIAVAGGTTAIASKVTAPKNSVTTKSIRPHNVTARNLTKIVTVTREASFSDPVPPDGVYSGTIASSGCPPGTRIISGNALINGGSNTFLTSSGQTGVGWNASGRSDGGGKVTLTVTANCLAKTPDNP